MIGLNRGGKLMKPGLIGIALVSLMFVGCMTPNIASLPKSQRLTAPPPGKALVNFHSTYDGWYPYQIYDQEGRNICEMPGWSQFQYVCSPGEHVFMGWADWVTVVEANLAPDKVYDIMVDRPSLGMMKPGIVMNPVLKDDPRRLAMAEFEDRIVSQRKNLRVRLIPAYPFTDYPNSAAAYEKREAGRIAEIKRDFLNGGEKADRVKLLGPDDCR